MTSKILALLALAGCGTIEDDVVGPGACCITTGGNDAIRACLARRLSGPGDCTYAECFPSFDKLFVCSDGTTDEDLVETSPSAATNLGDKEAR